MTLSTFIEEKSAKATISMSDLLLLGDSEDLVDTHYTIKKLTISQLASTLNSQSHGTYVSTLTTTDSYESIYTITIAEDTARNLDIEIIAYTLDGSSNLQYSAFYNLKGFFHRIGSATPEIMPDEFGYKTIYYNNTNLADLEMKFAANVDGTIELQLKGLASDVYWDMLIRDSNNWSTY